MRALTPCIAAFATLAYLTAALLPCEPPAAWPSSSQTRGSVHAAASPPGAAVPAALHDHAPAAHAAHGSASGHGHGHASHPAHGAAHDHASHPVHDATHDHASHPAHDATHDHASHPAHDAARGSVRHHAHGSGHGEVGRADRDPSAGLALRAQCLCGCSETRAWIGGGAARLGSVVPGAHVARLVEADRVVPVDRVETRFVERFAEHDPVPI